MLIASDTHIAEYNIFDIRDNYVNYGYNTLKEMILMLLYYLIKTISKESEYCTTKHFKFKYSNKPNTFYFLNVNIRSISLFFSSCGICICLIFKWWYCMRCTVSFFILYDWINYHVSFHIGHIKKDRICACRIIKHKQIGVISSVKVTNP